MRPVRFCLLIISKIALEMEHRGVGGVLGGQVLSGVWPCFSTSLGFVGWHVGSLWLWLDVWLPEAAAVTE